MMFSSGFSCKTIARREERASMKLYELLYLARVFGHKKRTAQNYRQPRQAKQVTAIMQPVQRVVNVSRGQWHLYTDEECRAIEEDMNTTYKIVMNLFTSGF